MKAFPSRLRVGLLGGVAMVALTCGFATAQAAQPNPGITIDNFAFTPSETTIPVGTTLTWTNAQGGVPHTTTSLDGVWDSGVLSTNQTFTFEFDQPGDFAYQCDVHPSMKGVVHVAAATPTDSSASGPVATNAGATNQGATNQGDQAASAATSAATPQPTSAPATATPTSTPTQTATQVQPAYQRAAATATPASYYGY